MIGGGFSEVHNRVEDEDAAAEGIFHRVRPSSMTWLGAEIPAPQLFRRPNRFFSFA